MSGVNEIRSVFLDSFARAGHEIVASSPLVPRNDPTLMFANSGMVQFKNVFTGLEKRPYSRAATAQKCVRAGGKHNDLDNVGYTARHHTFFEMLGNFSFGDYFKDRAIELAWNLITKEYGLAKDRLYVTVYHEDKEAHELWKKIAGLPESRIIPIATSDNFWSMGDTGPCGPCSEIFYDHGDHIWGGPPGSAEQDGDRFIEIWNLVFMQFEQVSAGERIALPKPSIDTGMGLERISAVLQGQHDNYDIDLFRALISASVEATGVPVTGETRASHRVIADHLRASSFLIADGVLPSNEGRGYVLRRIMRRAMRHASLLGASDPLMWKLVPALANQMGGAYPELLRAQTLIAETLQLEETRFRKTLERGLVLLEEATGSFAKGDLLDGETAFKLYDTYGFPLDLTQDALKARGIHVDLDGFSSAMERQRSEARASWAGSGEAQDERVWFTLKERVGASEFLGYATEKAEAVVQAIVADGAEIASAAIGQKVGVVLNQTPFYAESGGQLGDHGEIRFEGGIMAVSDTRKKGSGLIVHSGEIIKGELKTGDGVELVVEHRGRQGLRAHHSATHLLHEALRQVLGSHVAQKGSMVAPDRLRFDFSHPKPISPDELARAEDMANIIVRQAAPVETRLMAVDDAIAAGAMALFGEKYGDEVRVVTMGSALGTDQSGKEAKDGKAGKAGEIYSMELCGGTHVRNTGEIGIIKLVGEAAVASGVRRIEALSGEAARRYLEEQEKRVMAIAALLKVPAADALMRVEALVEERRRLERELAEARMKMALGGAAGQEHGPEKINGIDFLGQIVEGIAAKDLKGLVDGAKARLGSGVAMMVATASDGKAGAVIGVTEDLTARISAVDLVRLASAALGGSGGGGRPDMAQAGGPDGSKAQAAIDAVRAAVAGLK